MLVIIILRISQLHDVSLEMPFYKCHIYFSQEFKHSKIHNPLFIYLPLVLSSLISTSSFSCFFFPFSFLLQDPSNLFLCFKTFHIFEGILLSPRLSLQTFNTFSLKAQRLSSRFDTLEEWRLEPLGIPFIFQLSIKVDIFSEAQGMALYIFLLIIYLYIYSSISSSLYLFTVYIRPLRRME